MLQYPNFNTDKALQNNSGLHAIDLTQWKEKFQKFIFESNYRPRLAPKPTPDFLELNSAQVQNNVRNEIPESSQNFPVSLIKERWQGFLKYLEEEGESTLNAHLQFCELRKSEGNSFLLYCEKRFSFELLADKTDLISEKASQYYGSSVKFIIKLDKEAVSKNDQFELNDRDLFKRLAESNELVKYLIQEFGAEPGL